MKKQDKIYSEILTISKTTAIPVKKILDFLWFLLKEKVVDNHQLIQRACISKNALNMIKKYLSSYLEASIQQNYFKKR